MSVYTDLPLNTHRLIAGEFSYDAAYRLRLWKALMDEQQFIGRGYRSLHTRIINELTEAQRLGWRLTNANGKNINIDELMPDDVYGFLGKSKDGPSAPQRHLSDTKIRVIDLYFKYKYPVISTVIKNSGRSREIAKILSDYLSNGPDNSCIPIFNEIIKPANGSFLSIRRINLGAPQPIELISLSETVLHLVSVHIKKVHSSPYCEVHFVSTPLSEDDIFPESAHKLDIDWDIQRAARRVDSSSYIYSGIGLPIMASSDGEFYTCRILSIMKEMVSNNSKSTNVNLSFMRNEQNQEWYGGVLMSSFGEEYIDIEDNYNILSNGICELAIKNDTILKSNLYTKACIENIYRIRSGLGEGLL